MKLVNFKKTLSRFCAIGAILSAGIASATTWYIAPGGSDAAAGTFSAPFKSLAKATIMSSAGDTILCRGGTYTITDNLPGPNYAQNIRGKGTSTSWVEIKNYPSEVPVFECSGYTPGNPIIVTADTGTNAYLSIDGLQFTGSRFIGLCAYNVNHVKFKNIKVSGATGSGIYIGSNGGTQDFEVTNCEVTDCSRTNSSLTATTWPPALFIDYVTNISIQGCNVHENFGEGIGVRRGTTVDISGNSAWDNFSVNIYLDNTHYADVYNNNVYTTSNSSFYRTVGGVARRADGIGVAQETISGWATTPMEYIHIYSNTVSNNNTGIYFSDFASGATTSTSNCYINNCTGTSNGTNIYLAPYKIGTVTTSGNVWY